MPSVKRKHNVKSLGKKYQALRDLEKGPQTKTLVKNMMYPIVKPSSLQITNALNTLQNLGLVQVENDMVQLLQRFKSLHVHEAARKPYSVLTYFNRK